MAQYFMWKRSNRKDEPPPEYMKPRSRSLDPHALEASGIRQIVLRVCSHNMYIYFTLL